MDILKCSFASLVLSILLFSNNSYAPWASFYGTYYRYRVVSVNFPRMLVYASGGIGYTNLYYDKTTNSWTQAIRRNNGRGMRGHGCRLKV